MKSGKKVCEVIKLSGLVVLYYVKEVAMILFYLGLPIYLTHAVVSYHSEKRERKERVNELVSKLIDMATDETPIVFKVDQRELVRQVVEKIKKEELLENVVNEIKKR